jgi:hypothetical protein
MHVDFKVTTWERCHLPDDLDPEQIEDLKRKIEEGIITDYDDLNEECGVDSTEKLLECDENLTVEENGGCSTVELHMEKGQLNPTITNSESDNKILRGDE